ncbi:MAG: tetratricopeptide repeat protein [Ignavibacteriaceae bacterium]
MYRSKFLTIAILFIGLAVTGFQCASTELTSAKLYIQQKNYDKALASLKREVEKNPQSDEGYYLLGLVSGEQGDYATLIDSYAKSLAISSLFAKDIDQSKKYFWANLFNQGVGYFQKGNNVTDKDSMKVFYGKSINAFETATKIEPDSIDTYKNLAFVYLSAQEYDSAIAPLQKLVDNGHSVDGYKYLGEIYYNKGANLKTQFATSHNAQDSVDAVNNFEKAITILQEGRKYYPNNSDLLLYLSNAYIGAHKVDVAIDAFKAGVEQEPANKYYRYNYGVLLLGNKDYQDAEEQFKKAIDIDPNYQNAIYNLAVTYVKWAGDIKKDLDAKNDTTTAPFKDKYVKALPYLEKVVSLKDNDPNMWELLAKVYATLGYEKEATDAMDKADKLRK